MRQTLAISVEPAENSLATWVNDLGPSSACFCCGAPLFPSIESRSTGQLSLSLSCPLCGAGVDWVETLGAKNLATELATV